MDDTLTPSQAMYLCYNLVTDWLAAHTGIAQSDINTSKPFSRYGVTEGAYLDMCNEMIRALNKATSREVVLTPEWRLENRNVTIQQFIANLATALLGSPMTSFGRMAMAASRVGNTSGQAGRAARKAPVRRRRA